ncbi:MAG: DUF6783 domain-containing protein [Ruminococcus sp.]
MSGCQAVKLTRYAENWGVQHEEMIFGTRSSMGTR